MERKSDSAERRPADDATVSCIGCTRTRRTASFTSSRRRCARSRSREFFTIWGQPLSRTQAASMKSDKGAPLKFWVNGQPYTGDPRKIQLTAHADVVIEAGPPYPEAAQVHELGCALVRGWMTHSSGSRTSRPTATVCSRSTSRRRSSMPAERRYGRALSRMLKATRRTAANGDTFSRCRSRRPASRRSSSSTTPS